MLGPRYTVIDRRLILEIFINTSEDKFVLQLWRIPSKSNHYSIDFSTIIDLKDHPVQFIPFKILKVNKKGTIKEMVVTVLTAYNISVSVFLQNQTVCSDEEKKMVERRSKILKEFVDQWNSDETDTTELINPNRYQKYEL